MSVCLSVCLAVCVYLAVAHPFTCLKCPKVTSASHNLSISFLSVAFSPPLPSPPLPSLQPIARGGLLQAHRQWGPHSSCSPCFHQPALAAHHVQGERVGGSNFQHTAHFLRRHSACANLFSCTLHTCMHTQCHVYKQMSPAPHPLLPAHSPPFPTPAPRPLLPTPTPCPCSQIKTTSPSRYRVKPNISKIDPGQSMNVHIHLLQGTPHGEDRDSLVIRVLYLFCCLPCCSCRRSGAPRASVTGQVPRPGLPYGPGCP